VDSIVRVRASPVDSNISIAERPEDPARRHLSQELFYHTVCPPIIVVRAEFYRCAMRGHGSKHTKDHRARQQLTKPREPATLARMGAAQSGSLIGFFSGPVFLSAFFSWFIAQLLKTIIDIYRQRSRTSGEVVSTMVWKTGGMPSSHSSLVTSLATSIGFVHGVNSPIFVLSLFYGLLIIRDALGVRRSAGMQATTLNAMGAKLKDAIGYEYTPVKEVHGHSPTEVAVGVGLGFFIALAFALL
jgi:hypothetical protein